MARLVTERSYVAAWNHDITHLSPACYIDFGLDNKETFDERFIALVRAVERGASLEEFDAALGDNQKLTELVQKYGSKVVFSGENAWEVIKRSGILL